MTIVWQLSLASFPGFDHLYNPHVQVVKMHQVKWWEEKAVCVCVCVCVWAECTVCAKHLCSVQHHAYVVTKIILND